jgi:hypothetical protein
MFQSVKNCGGFWHTLLPCIEYLSYLVTEPIDAL